MANGKFPLEGVTQQYEFLKHELELATKRVDEAAQNLADRQQAKASLEKDVAQWEALYRLVMDEARKESR